MKMITVGSVVALALGCVAADAVNLRPWEETRRTLKAEGQVARTDLMDLKWHANGSEGKVAVVPADDGAGRMLDWTIDIDHHSAGAYPVGWPSFEALPRPMKDFSGKGAIAFRMRALGDIGRPQVVRFILKHGEGKMVNVPLPGIVPGDGWREVTVEIGNAAWLKEVDRIHFFICEEEYRHGEKLRFQFRDFRLGALTSEPVPLAAGCAGATLWVGDRADGDSRAVLLDEGTAKLSAVLHVENRLGRAIPAEAQVRFRLRDVFTGKDTVRTLPLGTAVAPGAHARIALACDLAGLVPDYYHVLADVLVDGKSVLDIRKGSDDFYVRRRGETMTASMLALRLGMAYWVMDRIHGGFVHSTDIALPHCYDPYDASLASYGAFMKRFAHMTTKVCEGYEAGMPGLALAAEAYRKEGNAVRCAFAEKLLWNSCEAVLTMQDACGGVLTAVNELRDDGIGCGWGGNARNSTYSSDQTAEWMRGLVYATLYYLRRGGETEKIARLNAACVKAGRFLVANGLQEKDGVPGVIHNFTLSLQADGKVGRHIYHQEGRQCDVYQPRVVAGLAYTALALLKSGEKVPADWWNVFDASSKWMAQKMKPNGWFDWQCGDVVEGGCHTFLGNIYLGEGLFGVVMANRAAGRTAEAERVLPAARKAYRYVTDDCWIRGTRYRYPLEFWVGPYVYWLFIEWERHVGPEPAFRDWIETLDRKWSVERKWGDFMRMPGMDCGRAKGNGMLTIAILGSLAIRHMDELGYRWTLVD